MDRFTNVQMEILGDMVEYWADKDRHGELRSEWVYDDEMLEAFSELYVTIKDECRKLR